MIWISARNWILSNLAQSQYLIIINFAINSFGFPGERVTRNGYSNKHSLAETQVQNIKVHC